MAEASDRRLYKNPPLIEAVLEFQFPPNPNWDSTFLGQIRERLPSFPRLETIRGGELVVEQERVGFHTAPEGKRFWRSDSGMAVTVLPSVVAVSAIPPSMPEGHRWERLRDQGLDVLEEYLAVTSPGGIRQVGLRYINALPIDPEHFRLGDWIADTSGLVPESLMEETNPFSLRVERVTEAVDNYQRREVITLAVQHQPTYGWRLMLDVDEVTLWQRPPERSGLGLVLESMHGAVHDVFIRVLRPAVLETFGPVDTMA